jgi:hypothetical protein
MSVVIVHPEFGIYLGSFIGLGFWSKLDPAGQDAAVTFPSQQDAEQFMGTWDEGAPQGCQFITVIPDQGEYASVSACVAAGLEAWSVEVPSGEGLVH